VASIIGRKIYHYHTQLHEEYIDQTVFRIITKNYTRINRPQAVVNTTALPTVIVCSNSNFIISGISLSNSILQQEKPFQTLTTNMTSSSSILNIFTACSNAAYTADGHFLTRDAFAHYFVRSAEPYIDTDHYIPLYIILHPSMITQSRALQVQIAALTIISLMLFVLILLLYRFMLTEKHINSTLKKAISMTQANYRLMLENSNDFFLVLTTAGIIQYADEKLFNASKWPKMSLLQSPLIDFIHPDDKKDVNKTLLHLHQTKTVRNIIARFRQANDTWIITDSNFYYMYDSFLQTNLIYCTCENITQDAVMARKLLEAEGKYKALVDNAPFGIALLQNDLITYVNNQFYILFESTPADTLDHLWNAFLNNTIMIAENHSSDETHTITITTRSGKQKKISFLSHEILLQNKSARQIIVIDTSEREKLLEQIMVAQKMESIGRLAGGIAHDFNNLLSIILGYTTLLNESVSPKTEEHMYLQQIQASSEQAALLTQQLLNFTRRGTNPETTIGLKELLIKMKHILDNMLTPGIDFSISLPYEELFIDGDASQLQQVFINLVINARDAMPTGGMLSINVTKITPNLTLRERFILHEKTPYTQISVRDNGIGMSEEIQQKIFEPFFTTKNSQENSGLGLYTVYGIIKKHNGRITCISKPNHGTEFILFLPCSVHTI